MTSENINTKQCIKCRSIKPLNEFPKDSSRRSGKKAYCKTCSNKYSKGYNRSEHGHISQIYGNMRSNSKARNHRMPAFTKDELSSWLHANNYRSIYDAWAESGFNKNLAPSCDRTDDYQGYSLDRLSLMTWGENKQKSHDDMKIGKNNKINRAVIQLTIDGLVVNEYCSRQQASRFTGIHGSTISMCCNGRLELAGGYVWRNA